MDETKTVEFDDGTVIRVTNDAEARVVSYDGLWIGLESRHGYTRAVKADGAVIVPFETSNNRYIVFYDETFGRDPHHNIKLAHERGISIDKEDFNGSYYANGLHYDVNPAEWDDN